MKYFNEIVQQKCKQNYIVCGDVYLSTRTDRGTLFILCDGVGSGIYANIAAITCAYRLRDLVKECASIQIACEKVAASMHSAKTGDAPYVAFSAAHIRPGGEFTVYTYEAPPPIIISGDQASTMETMYFESGEETMEESVGKLKYGDSLLLMSDGMTQSGMGRNMGLGIGNDGVEKFINSRLSKGISLEKLSEELMDYSCKLCGGEFEDDTTLAILNCREARTLTIITGPPMNKSADRTITEKFMNSPGKKVVCGSTTTNIIARESGSEVTLLKISKSFSPPEYGIEGVDLATEGAIVLNQVYNILNEPVENLTGGSPAEKLCKMIHEADAIKLMMGGIVNSAHTDVVFKQIGIHPRKLILELLRDELIKMGKMVLEERF